MRSIYSRTHRRVELLFKLLSKAEDQKTNSLGDDDNTDCVNKDNNEEKKMNDTLCTVSMYDKSFNSISTTIEDAVDNHSEKEDEMCTYGT